VSDVTFPDEFGTPVVGLCFPESLSQTNKNITLGRKARPSASVMLVASSGKISIFGAEVYFCKMSLTIQAANRRDQSTLQSSCSHHHQT